MPRPVHPERRPAVVAGASTGIGAAAAVALAAAGHPVALGARRVELCEETVAAIRASGGEAVAHPLDVADDASVSSFAAKAVADLGDIEVVVYNAGVNVPKAVGASTAADLETMLQVNTLGAQRAIEAFAPGMIGRRRGDLVFVSSDVIDTLRPFTGSYNASKWALEGLVRTFQRELEGTGVRASLVRPGPTGTEMGMDWDAEATGQVLESWVSWGLARHSRFLPPEALAAAILTVVSAPRGVHLTAVDVQPEAPLTEPAPTDQTPGETP